MWLVTGGAGFIGSHLMRRLSDVRDVSLALCDTLGHGQQWMYLRHVRLDHCILPDQLAGFLDSEQNCIQGVIHLGAISDTRVTDGDLVIQNNFQLSQKLWHFCAHHSIPFLYASSAATYGLGSQESAQSFSDAPELLAHLCPLNLYGWSKHIFDLWVYRQVRTGQPTPSQWCGLKFFNVYGPHELHKGGQRSVVSVLYEALQQDGQTSARLFKSYRPEIPHGEQKRDFIWVEDCVDVMLWLQDHPHVSGIFNVGTGQARSFNDLARALFTALDRPSLLTYIDMPESLEAQYQYYTQADVTRLRAQGYDKAWTSLEQGTAFYIQRRQQDPISSCM